MRQKRWNLRSGDINEFVYAADQWVAFDILKERSAFEFGLIVEAEPDENDDPFLVRTSLLMYRWHRDSDAERFISRGMEEGMPDTTAEDLKARAEK